MIPAGNVTVETRLVALTYHANYFIGSSKGAADAAVTWLANTRQGDASMFTPTAAQGVDGGLFAPTVVSITARVSGFLVGRDWGHVLAPIHTGEQSGYRFELQDARVTQSTAVDTTAATDALKDLAIGERLAGAAGDLGKAAGEAVKPVLVPLLVAALVLAAVLLLPKGKGSLSWQ
jgi:hypothetical protein